MSRTTNTGRTNHENVCPWRDRTRRRRERELRRTQTAD
nr:MAG TPA: hypothetical protein [Caudoviricetes sp.]